MGANSLPKTVTRQRRGCDLSPGPSAPESSTLTTRLLGDSRVAAAAATLTAHGLQVEQDLGDDDRCIEHHQQTEDDLDRTTLECLHRPTSASAHAHAHNTPCGFVYHQL